MSKICFLTSFVFNHGGEQRVTVVIANELAKKHQVIIYSQDTEADAKKNPYGLEPQIEVRKIEQPQFGLLNRLGRRAVREVNERTDLFYKKASGLRLLEYAYFQKAWQEQMISELSKEPYDVIVAVSGGNTLRLGMIADRLPCRTIGWEHNAFEAYFRSKNEYFWHQDALFGEAIRRLDHCVVLNEHIRDQYLAAFGKACDVIYNPRSFISEEKSKLEEKTFVACGRIIRQKGFDLLVESYRTYRQKGGTWKLVIVGDGDDRKALQEQIEAYQLADMVTITGYTNDVRSYLLHASVYVLSSRWEGFPMVVTEAYEMGLPVVAYDITAVAPLLTDGKQGYLAKAFDTEDFAGQMLRMEQAGSSERKEMQRAAAAAAEALSIERIIECWNRLLEI